MSESTRNPVRGVSFDWMLLLTVLALLCFGVVMVYSASAIEGFKRFGDPEHFVIRQAVYSVIGLGAMAFAIVFDYRSYKSIVYWLLGLVILALLICFTPLGAEINGASRWIRLGPMTVQPGELAKISLVLWLSYSLAKKKDKIKKYMLTSYPF